jgi:hypothetical protein
MEFSVSGNDGTVFLESRDIQSNPEIFLSNAVDSIAGYPGIFLQTEMFIPEEARTRVSELLGATPDALDFLLDFLVTVVMSDLEDEELRALGIQINHGEAFLAQSRILVDNSLFLWFDLEAIEALPVEDLLGEDSGIDLGELIDALLLELDELGLSDISQALAAGQPLQITGFEDVLDLATIVPGPDTAQQISESISSFLTDVASVTFLESTENGDWLRTETDTANLIKFLLDLASDLGLDEAGEGDLFTLEEIEALIDELELAQTVIAEFLISEGELIFLTIELASLDPTLGLNFGDIWLDLYLGRYTDSVLPFENAVLFDLCRLPEDTFDCSP